MNVHWVFHDVDKAKQHARTYWNKKQCRLERLLAHYRPELCDFRVTLYRHAGHEQWELRAVLRLPTGTLVAEELRDTLEEVIDKVVDKLAGEIKRHKQRVRKDYAYHQKTVSGADLEE